MALRFAIPGCMLLPLLLLQPYPGLTLPFWGWMGVLIPLELLSMFLYLRAIHVSPLSQTLPYLALTPIFTILTGSIFLSEQISWSGLAGIIMVVLGAYLMNVQKAFSKQKGAWLLPFKAIIDEPGSRLMLAVAFLYSLTSVIGKKVLDFVPATFFGPFYFVLLGLITMAILLIREPRSLRRLSHRPVAQFLVGFAMAVMAITHYLAIQRVEVAYMIAVKRSSLLFGIIYGVILFNENRLVQHLLAGAIMVAGLFFIADA